MSGLTNNGDAAPAAAADITSGTSGVGSDEKGISQLVASHYNDLKESGVEFRKESRIYYMRNFNNWTKSMLIQEYVDKIKAVRPELKEHRPWRELEHRGYQPSYDHRHRGRDHRDRGREYRPHRHEPSQREHHSFSVLDMGCGKGGDLLKWGKACITDIVCVDIADVSVQQAKSRHQDMIRK